MGKKRKRERAEKRESFADQRRTKKRKNMLIAAGIFAVVGVIVGYSAYNFVTNFGGEALGAPPNAGTFNDEHEHGSILVMIHRDKFDFSAGAYQVQDNWIHFESQDGSTIHRHSSGVTLGYLFETLGIGLDEECYVFPSERSFCTDENYSLKFYINGERVDSINDYVIQDEDRILISYGGETEEQIQEQLDELNAQPIIV